MVKGLWVYILSMFEYSFVLENSRSQIMGADGLYTALLGKAEILIYDVKTRDVTGLTTGRPHHDDAYIRGLKIIHNLKAYQTVQEDRLVVCAAEDIRSGQGCRASAEMTWRESNHPSSCFNPISDLTIATIKKKSFFNPIQTNIPCCPAR
jgi:hypothetical protein